MQWETVIGLETHAQLSTVSKMFSGASTVFGAAPNTQASAVDIAMPGVLPVVNKGAIERAIRFALAIGANINRRSVFARKNYFYPDLPKGYQISQYELPIVQGGEISIVTKQGEKKIRLTRAHLEEDTGKSLHEDFHGMSGIDLNRAGTPLLEIVSEPDMRSAEEAVAYAKILHALVRWIDICDGNMQEGSFRCDANVSVRRPDAPLGTRCEIKNLNSFRFLERAAEITGSLVGARIGLPQVKRSEYVHDYGLAKDEAVLLTQSREIAEYFEDLVARLGKKEARLCANWIMGELSGALNRHNLDIAQSPVSSGQLAGLLLRLRDNTLSGKMAKEVFEAMWAGEGSADEIIDKRGLKQISDAGAIEKIVDQILAANAKQAEDYRAGKEKAFNSLVGQVMKATQGKANPAQVNEILKRKLAG